MAGVPKEAVVPYTRLGPEGMPVCSAVNGVINRVVRHAGNSLSIGPLENASAKLILKTSAVGILPVSDTQTKYLFTDPQNLQDGKLREGSDVIVVERDIDSSQTTVSLSKFSEGVLKQIKESEAIVLRSAFGGLGYDYELSGAQYGEVIQGTIKGDELYELTIALGYLKESLRPLTPSYSGEIGRQELGIISQVERQEEHVRNEAYLNGYVSRRGF